jgi:hypothetical protein
VGSVSALVFSTQLSLQVAGLTSRYPLRPPSPLHGNTEAALGVNDWIPDGITSS